MASYLKDQKIWVGLREPLSFPGSFESIEIRDSRFGSVMEISLRRTVRVPDNSKNYELPPDCGPFPLYSISEHEDKLPKDLVAKGGIFVPVRNREALWINFSSTDSFAVKVYVGGVNAISGEPKTVDSKRGKKAVQDYIVTPDQDWLDGIARADGTVSQFVGAASGSGYSVEAQVTGSDSLCGLQFEIIPNKNAAMLERFSGAESEVFLRTLSGKFYSLNVPLSLLVKDFRHVIRLIEGIPPHLQRLIFAGKQMEDERTLLDYGVTAGSTIHLIMRMKGGGGPSEKLIAARVESKFMEEMAIAPGGLIKQTIAKDKLSAEDWDAERSVMFNVQFFDGASFSKIGLPLPPTPITAKTYSELGYPFFKKYEELSGVSGSFNVKSVGELDKEAGVNQDVHDAEEELSFSELDLRQDPYSEFTYAPVSANTVDAISAFVPVAQRVEVKK